MTEAVYYGVPFIGIPAFADQPYNVLNAVHRKIAVEFDMKNLNEVDFTAAIKEILGNPVYVLIVSPITERVLISSCSYKENIARYSALLRDQPVPPMDLAVYWVEHVMKHKGAPHLQSAGLKLNWIQAYLLDVIVLLVTLISTLVYVNFLILRTCVRFFRRKLCSKKKLKAN